jgi:chemosensory pili system protein ChpE
MLTLVVSAFVLGLVFNAAPGAVFVQTVRQGMRGGFRAAFAVQVGSLAGDALWAVLGLAGAGVLMHIEALRWPLGLAGVLYLAWLSLDSWRAASRKIVIAGDAPQGGNGHALRSGVLLSVTNPQNLAYWAALGSAMTALGMADPGAAEYLAFFGGFMAASVVWCFVCAALVHALFARAGSSWAGFTHRLCAIALLALAVASLRDLLDAPRRGGAPASSTVPAQGLPWQR